jgi:hypothetical protein
MRREGRGYRPALLANAGCGEELQLSAITALMFEHVHVHQGCTAVDALHAVGTALGVRAQPPNLAIASVAHHQQERLLRGVRGVHHQHVNAGNDAADAWPGRCVCLLWAEV